jgi:hypothetical protein
MHVELDQVRLEHSLGTFTMRTTLRRSCNACARAKHGCDLQTPKCSRCLKRNVDCVYANAPATSSSSPSASPTDYDGSLARVSRGSRLLRASTVSSDSMSKSPEPSEGIGMILDPVDASFDPFDSYPATRVARPQIQRLIHHCSSQPQRPPNLTLRGPSC